jgi:hypothetical protein
MGVVSERPIFIVLGVAIEYNDSDYDIYPQSIIHSVHTDKASAEQARLDVANDASRGWNPNDISPGSLKDGETVSDAVLRCVALCETSVNEDAVLSGEPLYALLAPSGAVRGEWGCSWEPSKCWGVRRREESVELARDVVRTLRSQAQRVMSDDREDPWMMSHLSDLLRLHSLEVPS